MRPALILLLLFLCHVCYAQRKVPDQLIYAALDSADARRTDNDNALSEMFVIRDSTTKHIDLTAYKYLVPIEYNAGWDILKKRDKQHRSAYVCNMSLRGTGDTSYLHCKCDQHTYDETQIFYRLRFRKEPWHMITPSCMTSYMPMARFVFLKEEQKWQLSTTEDLWNERFGIHK